jgi:hypothetical protein
MSRRSSPVRRSDGLTGDMFSPIPSPMPKHAGTMDFRRPVASLLSELLRQTHGSRYTVAARMSELSDVETSKALLDSYTAEAREGHNIPFWKVPLIEAATDRRDLLEWHAAVLGARVIYGDEIIDADVGRLQRQLGELQDQLKGLQKQQKRGGRR